ncbi:MAG: LacI family DNA-binding transcriptional regulator [Pirellulaceae bacterium]|nr:LacI family DNA-binding transcriptional regulator [Pirellulaceae bacterium]
MVSRTSGTTIQDIAQRANVSKSTVSRVLNDSAGVNQDKRAAVTRAMKAMGYQPSVLARSLAGGQSMTIGILTQNIGSPFYDTVAQGVIARLAGTGYSPIFVDGRWNESTEVEVVQALLDRKVDGLVLIGEVPESTFDEVRQQVPTIVVGRDLSDWKHCIFVDNRDIGYLATKHLIDAGHTEIAMIGGIEHHPDAKLRYQGYVQALRDAGIQPDPELYFCGNFSSQSGVMAIKSFLTRGKNFSAVFAANDAMAFGANLAFYRSGIRVPEDISIVGVDDQAESAFMTPPLTTVRQPAAEMGNLAAEALLKLIKGDSCELKTLPADLQIRESVARRR